MTLAIPFAFAVAGVAGVLATADAVLRITSVWRCLSARAASLRPQPAARFSQSDIAIAGGE